MAGYNEAVCNHQHKEISYDLEEGKRRMDAHDTMLHAHSEQLAIIRELAARRDNVFWQLLSPLLSVAGGIVTGLVLAYFFATQ